MRPVDGDAKLKENILVLNTVAKLTFLKITIKDSGHHCSEAQMDRSNTEFSNHCHGRGIMIKYLF